ncbi:MULTISPECIES: O-acetyl-ADP-ribose deacetylase [Methanosarcina]|uniref:O-acetyl-ADP-ribose deacetylase n=1 Tax=Methanosarcina TaxID=2207 RepID=UPI00190F0D4B|nr:MULTISPECIES: O-acetyl-ADP-ribose deacetylase [Methanosarcina]
MELNIDRIRIFEGDIVKMRVDAIVNAANNTLLGGGGVDGAIHRAAGPALLEECKTLNGCPTGEAKITSGYLLPAKYIIHTVGPVWQGGEKGENELLASCYRKSLELARDYKIKTIAFPAISTGAYSFPSERAAGIAVSQVKEFLQKNEIPETVYLVCYNKDSCKSIKKALSKIL